MTSTCKIVGITSGVVFGVAALLTIILVPASLRDVEFDELAVHYDDLTKIVDKNKVLEEGRHVLLPQSKLFKFKRTLQTIDLSGENEINCLTKEGLNMALDITTQYQIIKEKLFDIFEEYGEEEYWVTYVRSVTRDTIKDVCSEFTGEDFFFRRGDIEQQMSQQLVSAYSQSNAYATSELVQLRNVMHPSSYEKANQGKQETEQEKDRVLSEREQKLTDIQTELLKAEADAEIKLTRAQGQADAKISEANELAKAEIRKWQERASAYDSVKQQLGDNVTNLELINEYLKYVAITEQEKPIINIQ